MKKIESSLCLLIGFVFLSAWSALPSRIAGFSPHFAIMFFVGFLFKTKKTQAIIISISMIFFKDILYQILFINHIGNVYGLYGWAQVINYILLLSVVCIGMIASHKKNIRFMLLNISATTIYFLLSNSIEWLCSPMYADMQNIQGLMTSYILALPFYLKSIAGTIGFAALFLTIYQWTLHYQQKKTTHIHS